MRYKIQTTTELANLLRTLRIQRGMTQRDLAASAGVGRQRISEIESGKGGLRVTSFIALLDALDADLVINEREQREGQVDLDDLLGLGNDDD